MKTRHSSLLFASALMFSPNVAFAQATWNGADGGNWNDPSNWTGVAPGDSGTSALIFGTSEVNRSSINGLTNLTVSALTVDATSKDNTITGNAINLGGTIAVNTGNWQVIALDMNLTGNRTLNVGAGHLFLTGNLSGASGALTKESGAQLTLSGNNSFGGATRLTISNGSVNITSTNALGAAGGLINFANFNNKTLAIVSNTPINKYNISGGSSGSSDTVTVGRASAGAGFVQPFGTLDLGSRPLTFNQGANVTEGQMTVSIDEVRLTAGNNNSPVSLAGSALITVGSATRATNAGAERRLQLDGSNAGNTIGPISNGVGTVELIKAGSSTWSLTASNSYTGSTTISGGVLQLGNGGTVGSLPVGSAILNNAALGFNRSNTVTQGTDFSTSVTGSGGFRKSGAGNLVLNVENFPTGAVRDALTFFGGGSGTVTLTHPAALGPAGNVVRFSGGGSGVLDLQTDTSVNAYGIASGTFHGGTILLNRATSGANVTHNLGSLELSSVTLASNRGANVTGTAAVSYTDLRMTGGNDNAPATLAGNADITLGSASITLNGFGKRLGLDGTSANNIVTGVISDSTNGTTGAVVNVVKSNGSTWRLTGENTYTGTTLISGGVLQLGNGGAVGSLHTASAITNNATLAFNRSNTITQGIDFSSNLSGTGGIRKNNSNELILNAANLAGAVREVLTFSGNSSGTVSLRDPAALGSAGNTIRFSGGGSGILDLQSDTSVNAYSITSGSGNGGTLVINRATSGASITHQLGILDLSSVTITANKGSNVTGTAAVSFTEVRMTGGNDNNPVTLAGNSQITLGSASITFNGMPKRLQLSGTHSDNQVTGIISDTSNGTAGAKVTLIKSDTSTWHLMGSNSYTGETIVNSGTLILSQPSLDDTAAVRLTGTLQLNHSQTDTVGELYIAGQLQQPGIYDAANSDGYITGTGKLRVPGASGFDSWAAEQITNISPSADSTPGGDPDSDGMSNLAEFAFGGDPLSSASLGIRNVFTADTTADADTDKELILTLAVRAGETLEAFAGSPLQLAVAGVTYTIEGSLDLASFTAPVTEVAPVIEGLPSLPDGYEYRSFSLDGSNGLSGKGFLRAKVEN